MLRRLFQHYTTETKAAKYSDIFVFISANLYQTYFILPSSRLAAITPPVAIELQRQKLVEVTLAIRISPRNNSDNREILHRRTITMAAVLHNNR